MEEKYSDLMIELLKKNILRRGQAYDYADKPLERQLDEFFNAADSYIQQQVARLKDTPTYFFYEDSDDNSGYAQREEDYNLIAFKRGMVEKLWDFFHNQVALLDSPQFASLKIMVEETGVPLAETFFQYVMAFLLYHEYAHLIQRGGDAVFKHDDTEDGEAQADAVMDAHARELDADWVGASQIANLILADCRDEDGQIVDTSNIVEQAAVAVSALFCFWLMRSKGREVYYEEKDHPHPYIRLLWVATKIVENIAAVAPGANVDPKAIVNKAFEIAGAMLNNVQNASAKEFQDAFNENYDKLVQHIVDVDKHMKTMPNLCINRPDDALPR